MNLTLANILVPCIKLRRALNGPRQTEDNIRAGKGRIASAYREADKLCAVLAVDCAPTVTRIR
jgi:hypothetical protein